MKTIFVILLVAVAVNAIVEDGLPISDAEKKLIKDIQSKCVLQENVSNDKVNKFDEGKFEYGAELKQFFKCFFLNYGIMSADGNLVMSKLKSIMTEEQFEATEDCFKIKFDEQAETAYRSYECFIKKNFANQE